VVEADGMTFAACLDKVTETLSEAFSALREPAPPARKIS
jgi:hypothetical protein